jgi:hypothetical protein
MQRIKRLRLKLYFKISAILDILSEDRFELTTFFDSKPYRRKSNVKYSKSDIDKNLVETKVGHEKV